MGQHRLRLTDGEIDLLLQVIELHLPAGEYHYSDELTEEGHRLRALWFRLKDIRPGAPGSYIRQHKTPG